MAFAEAVNQSTSSVFNQDKHSTINPNFSLSGVLSKVEEHRSETTTNHKTMKTIVDLFRDSFAFQLFVGIVLFLCAQQSHFGNESTENKGHDPLEILFQEKFLEMNSVYHDHFLNY